MEAAAAASSRPLDCAAGDGSVTDRLLVDSGCQTEAPVKQRGGWRELRRKRCSVVSLASLGAVSFLLLAALLILLLGSHTWLHSHESDKLAVPQSGGDCMAASVGMHNITGTWTYEDQLESQMRTVQLLVRPKLDPAGFRCNGTSGLAPGQGVCWNPVEYNPCPTPWRPPPSPPPAMGTFTDDEGTKHTWAVAAPRVVTGAFQALTLMDMGLPASQIHGTFAERGTDGSNINGVYATSGTWGEVKGSHGDHANAEHEPAIHFLSDPSEEEQALLARMVDFSPSCSGSNVWCNAFNATLLDVHGWPDLFIVGPWFAGTVNDEVREIAAQRGVPIIHLNDLADPGGSMRRSFAELAERFEDLARALGADTTTHVAADKQRFCTAAAEFREVSREASQRGVRALAGYIPYGPVDSETGDVAAFLQSPHRNPALTMLEELGMSIIHLNIEQGSSRYYEWMVPAWGGPALAADGIVSSGGRDGTPVPYNADFFLYEPRGALDFTSDSFADAWPHPAVVQKQYAYYPNTALHYSWSHAADFMDVVKEKLVVAAKLDPAEYRCTDVEVIDSEHHRTTGLAPGQYACWNPVEYRWCPRTEPAPPPPPSPTTPDERGDGIESSSSYTDGQVAGLAVGLLVLGLLLGLIIGRLSSKWSPAVATHRATASSTTAAAVDRTPSLPE